MSNLRRCFLESKKACLIFAKWYSKNRLLKCLCFLRISKSPYPRIYGRYIEEHKLKPSEVERPSLRYIVSSQVGRRHFFLGANIRALSHLSAVEALLVQGGVRVGLMPGLVEVSQRGRLSHGDALIYVGVWFIHSVRQATFFPCSSGSLTAGDDGQLLSLCVATITCPSIGAWEAWPQTSISEAWIIRQA